MEPLASVAALSSAVLIVLVIAVLLLGLWLPPAPSDSHPLEQALRLQGDPVAARAFMRRDFRAALQRCDTCSQGAECRAWLVTAARDGYRHFCPNAAFIDRMKRVV
jgi:hypothetical protein